MRGLDGGRGGLRQLHHAGEGGDGDQARCEVGHAQTEDGAKEHETVVPAVRHWLGAPAVHDDQLESDGDYSETSRV